MLKLSGDGPDVFSRCLYLTASFACRSRWTCSGKTLRFRRGVRVCLLIGLALLAAGMAYGLLRYCGVLVFPDDDPPPFTCSTPAAGEGFQYLYVRDGVPGHSGGPVAGEGGAPCRPAEGRRSTPRPTAETAGLKKPPATPLLGGAFLFPFSSPCLLPPFCLGPPPLPTLPPAARRPKR